MQCTISQAGPQLFEGGGVSPPFIIPGENKTDTEIEISISI